ncbi:MAG: hypothetical protein ACJAU6_003593 [Alphaproteobacteria bacterium]|jgi:hypothetical protein
MAGAAVSPAIFLAYLKTFYSGTFYIHGNFSSEMAALPLYYSKFIQF